MSDFHEQIYSQDFDPGVSGHGWIQWKGTDVCIDLHCECGFHGHFDGCFLYFWECPQCHSKYALGQNIKLIALTEEQVQYVEEASTGFKTSVPDSDFD